MMHPPRVLSLQGLRPGTWCCTCLALVMLTKPAPVSTFRLVLCRTAWVPQDAVVSHEILAGIVVPSAKVFKGVTMHAYNRLVLTRQSVLLSSGGGGGLFSRRRHSVTGVGSKNSSKRSSPLLDGGVEPVTLVLCTDAVILVRVSWLDEEPLPSLSCERGS